MHVKREQDIGCPWVCMPACRFQMSTADVPPKLSTLLINAELLTEEWDVALTIKLCCLASEPQGSPSLHLPGAKIANLYTMPSF